MAVCTWHCSGWDWTRDLQSQVQRHNHYLAAPCIVTFLYYTYIIVILFVTVCHTIQGWLEEQKQYCDGSWHAWLSISLLSPPIFVTWNGAYCCIMTHTDIVIIHLSNFHHIRALNLAAEIWTSLKAGNTTKMISKHYHHKSGHYNVQRRGPFLRIQRIRQYFKVSDPAGQWCTLQFATIVDTPF